MLDLWLPGTTIVRPDVIQRENDDDLTATELAIMIPELGTDPPFVSA